MNAAGQLTLKASESCHKSSRNKNAYPNCVRLKSDWCDERADANRGETGFLDVFRRCVAAPSCLFEKGDRNAVPAKSIPEFIAKTGSCIRSIIQRGANVWVPICAAAFLSAGGAAAKAEHVNIVAIGESNTEGYGLKSIYAYPAVLEQLLRARGYDVSVTNEGVSGITTASILDRLSSAIPDGTKIVILQMGNYNDFVMGVSFAQSEANIKEAIARVRSRVSKLVFIGSPMFATIPRNLYQGDGLHLTEDGQAMMAQKILPQVVKAIGGR